MNWLHKFTNRAPEPTLMEIAELDPVMKQALGDFKASVHAWSDAALSRPRTVREVIVHRTWRLAAGWGLAAALLLGSVSGGLYEHHRRAVEAQAAARLAEQQHELAVQQARQRAEDDILLSLDSDIAREVPSAMEPLAAMTEDSSATGN